MPLLQKRLRSFRRNSDHCPGVWLIIYNCWNEFVCIQFALGVDNVRKIIPTVVLDVPRVLGCPSTASGAFMEPVLGPNFLLGIVRQMPNTYYNVFSSRIFGPNGNFKMPVIAAVVAIFRLSSMVTKSLILDMITNM